MNVFYSKNHTTSLVKEAAQFTIQFQQENLPVHGKPVTVGSGNKIQTDKNEEHLIFGNEEASTLLLFY